MMLAGCPPGGNGRRAGELLEQLVVKPDFVTACGFANAKRAGYEADDFRRLPLPPKSGAGVPSRLDYSGEPIDIFLKAPTKFPIVAALTITAGD